ncbi:MAG: PqqD family protein [Clostridia bacterium]|nr:PqqD family protein [Clostridia bacterium]
MKLKDGLLLRTLGDSHVVVPVGQAAIDLRGMITLNGTGAFLWERLQTPQTEEALVKALTDTYAVDEACAAADVKRFLEILREHALLDETEETV